MYRADISQPLVREAKIFRNLSELTPFIADIRENVTRVILFGSMRNGKDTGESDIDLLIETSDKSALQKIIARFERKSKEKFPPLSYLLKRAASPDP